MTEKELISKIKGFSSIKPDQEWVFLTKREILGQEDKVYRERVSGISDIFEVFPRFFFQYKLALASQGHKYNVLAMVEKFDFNKYFDVVLGKQDVNKSKPDPEIFLRAAEKLKVKPEECLVVEDSEKGIIAAKRARMKCIAIPDDWTKKYNDFSRADLIINDLNELSLDKIQSL